MNGGTQSRSEAQSRADRIRMVRRELAELEREGVLTLTAEQRGSFEEYADKTLKLLAEQFDVDTTDSQKRVSWGLRIASTLGGLAMCAAVLLFFSRYWGYVSTPVQVAVVMLLPLASLAGTEYAARKERTLYFAGLLALIALACSILNLAALGSIFNMTSSQNALLAWGLFALLLAYRYGLRPLLVMAVGFLLSWASATLMVRFGLHWVNFGDRPEHFVVMGLLVFAAPMVIVHKRHTDFPAVYRLAGVFVFFVAVLALAEWGGHSYFPGATKTIERIYEFLGLISTAGFIALGIRRQWDGVVNLSAAFFVIFLFCRLYHWWWDWMPRFVFFGVIGGIAILLVLAFKRMRAGLKEGAEA